MTTTKLRMSARDDDDDDNDDDEDELWSCRCGDGRSVHFSVLKLVEYSGYFSALMNSQMRETREKNLDLRFFSSDTINVLLKMFRFKDTKLCDGKFADIFYESLHLDYIEDLLKAIDYLDIPCLYPKCCDLLITILPPFCEEIDKLWQIWTVCETYGLEAVEDEIYKLIAKNISVLENKDYFFLREVPGNILCGVLSEHIIDISSEVGVMKLIKEWIVYGKVDRLRWFDSLYKCIHIPSLIHSNLSEIDEMIKALGVTDVDIVKTYSSYITNPHKYLLLRPDHCELRNGRKVLMLFGGVYAHSLMAHNQNGQRLRRSVQSIPIMYQDLEEVRCQCLNSYVPNPTESMPTNNSPRSKLSPVGSGLNLKLMNRLKSPMRLLEFGICSFDNFVFIAGGQRSNNEEANSAVKGAYRMDPHLGEWGEIAHMKEARCLFTLSSIWGRLYAVGGANEYGILSCTECYIPEEDIWCHGPQLPTQLHEHASCTFKGMLYISGGHDNVEHTDQVLVLQSKEGTWKPVAPMLQSRSYHSMVAMGDKMYVIGGCKKVGDAIKDLHSVEEYDPNSDTWTHLLNLNTPICCTLPVIVGKEVLFIGGYSFDEKEYFQQTVSLDLEEKQWKISLMTMGSTKTVVGYACLSLSVKQTVLK